MFNSKLTHTCSSCGATKPKKEFPKQTAKKSGVNSFCKECHSSRHRQEKYAGCVNGSVLDMLIKTELGCMICGTTKGKLCVDHCHKTNVIRGILCNACNVGIAQFKDDEALLTKAIEYLKQYGEGYDF